MITNEHVIDDLSKPWLAIDPTGDQGFLSFQLSIEFLGQTVVLDFSIRGISLRTVA